LHLITLSDTHIHTHIHTYIHAYIHTYTHTYVHTHTHTYKHSVGLLCTRDCPEADTSPPHNTQHSKETDRQTSMLFEGF
jgi:hypothetical protein